jgi:hypothetical protein
MIEMAVNIENIWQHMNIILVDLGITTYTLAFLIFENGDIIVWCSFSRPQNT